MRSVILCNKRICMCVYVCVELVAAVADTGDAGAEDGGKAGAKHSLLPHALQASAARLQAAASTKPQDFQVLFRFLATL